MIGMKIEWWMLDGIICLIVIISALIGAKKGLGDTILRLLGLAGGIILAVMYGKDVSEYLLKTPFRDTVYKRVFEIIRPEQDNYSKTLPGVIGEAADSAADKIAAETSARITEALMGIIAFVFVVLAVWLAVYIIRMLLRRGRKSSVIIGGTDSILGLSLGIVKGLIIACLFVAALVPGVTLFAPLKVPEVITAMQDSYPTKLIYDVNPLLIALKKAVGL